MKKTELQLLIREEIRKVLNEAYVPNNVLDYAKHRGITSLVKKVAGWAEKSGQKIKGGTAIGKDYGTLILDLTYQGGEIRINIDTEEVKLNGQSITDTRSFKKALELQESMAYGEKEAGEEIFNNPKIEAALKKIKGYDSIASGKPGDMYVYFRQRQSAITGAKLLDKLVPGPDYENSIVQDSGMWVIEIEPDNVNELGVSSLINKMYTKYEKDVDIKKAWLNIKKDNRFQDGYDKLNPKDQKKFESLFKEALKADSEQGSSYVINICKFIVQSNAFESSLTKQCKSIVDMS